MGKVAVIGGGPSGMMAAGFAAAGGHEVTLLEKNEKTGRKLYLTGKGRCNITNACDVEGIIANVPRNGKFLYSALYAFKSEDLIALLHAQGVETKIERGGRVFPQSDKSSDIIRALSSFARNSGAKIRLDCAVTGIEKTEQGFLVTVDHQRETFDAVVLATGGLSYPSTGSTGDGYAFARQFGHTVAEPKPSLIPFETQETWPFALAGLSLRNVRLSAYQGKKRIFDELGEMLFTHTGVSGPLVLSASGMVADAPEGTKLYIDLKPGLTHEMLEKRLLRDFEKNSSRIFANALHELLPSRLIGVMIELSKIAPDIIASQVTKQMRHAFAALLKAVPLTVRRARPIDEAIVTRGGVMVSQIDASTMESKLVPGLYFAGELIDVDALTGGYNLQIACSTGALAGKMMGRGRS